MDNEITGASMIMGGKEVSLEEYLIDSYRSPTGEKPISVSFQLVKGSKDGKQSKNVERKG